MIRAKRSIRTVNWADCIRRLSRKIQAFSWRFLFFSCVWSAKNIHVLNNSNSIYTLTWTLLSMSVVEFFTSDMFISNMVWYFYSKLSKKSNNFRFQITNWNFFSLFLWTTISPSLDLFTRISIRIWCTRKLDQQVIRMILQMFCFSPFIFFLQI